jgi:D-ribose pyranase
VKRDGILHGPLASALAQLGHTDVLVIADAGLPRPRGVPVIDLAIRFGLPSFHDIVTIVAAELVVEGSTVASEMAYKNPEAWALVTAHFGKPEEIRHDEFKRATADAALLIRTGEAKPFANVALRCGVPF